MIRTEHTQKWLDALRSGEYKQISGVLKNAFGYCCIGVAAELVGARTDCSNNTYEDAASAVGLEYDEMWKCVQMNDGVEGIRRHTFPEIADAIEQMLDGN